MYVQTATEGGVLCVVLEKPIGYIVRNYTSRYHFLGKVTWASWVGWPNEDWVEVTREYKKK